MNGSLAINQKAWLSVGLFDAETNIKYKRYDEQNLVYIFLIEGEVLIGAETLMQRDGIGITHGSIIELKITEPSKILVIEVPELTE